MANQYKENMGFEAEVRRVAEAVWNLESGTCKPQHYENNNVIKELDGIARLRDVTHLIMITTSTKLEKVKSDVKKLGAAEQIEKINSAVSKWLITSKQLDAEHIAYANKYNVETITLEQFKRRFFDSHKYLSLRSNASFGSARDPHTDTISISENAYVPLPMTVVEAPNKKNIKAGNITTKDICDLIEDGYAAILIAPFGAGKSLTTREIFKTLSKRYQEAPEKKTPISLNLREHWGQEYFDEILERHGRSIGYTPKEDLVIAWRSGITSLLLDGFDEVASQTIIRTDDKNFMRDARRKALQGVRDFTSKISSNAGIFICGRDHYFDSTPELISSLGLLSKKYIIIKLDEFTEDGAEEFLRRNNINSSLPDWIPRKPLILSYLLQNNLFKEITEIDSSKGFGYAWDNFLSRICDREASLERSVMEPATVRLVMERLATSVRSKASGVGPITGNDLSEAYNIVTRQAAGEGVLAQLQRLPGLTQRDSDPGSRSFVDEDMLSALQGSAFAKEILGDQNASRINAISELSSKAISMATYKMLEAETKPETIIAIAERQRRSASYNSNTDQFISDCIAIAIEMAKSLDYESLNFRGLIIDSANIGSLNLEEIRIQDLEIRNCIIKELTLSQEGISSNIAIKSCMINKIKGVADESGIPPTMIQDSEIESYDNMTTNNAVMNLDIPPQLKALITVLRKLYKQAGAGRKITALSRGITSPEVQNFITPVVKLLEAHELIKTYNKIAHPVRRQHSRVEKILSAPAIVSDPIITEAKSL